MNPATEYAPNKLSFIRIKRAVNEQTVHKTLKLPVREKKLETENNDTRVIYSNKN